MEDIKHYHLAALEISNETRCPLVNSWDLFLGNGTSPDPKLFSDGLHMSPEGNSLLFSGIFNKIKEQYYELNPVFMKVLFYLFLITGIVKRTKLTSNLNNRYSLI